MKKLLLIIMAMTGIFHATLLAQPAIQPDGLKPWSQLPEQNVAALLPNVNNAFEGNIASFGNIKLDSIIALQSELQYFTYDSLGHWLTHIDYSGWASDKKLYTAGYRHFNTYDNGFLVTQILKNYNYINKEWYFSFKAAFTNDAQGHRTSYTLYHWNTIQSTWEIQSKSVYSYSPSGKITLEIDSVLNTSTSKFDNSNKYEFQYDANGNLTLQTDYGWNADSLKWSIVSKNENSYNADGNIILSKKYSFGNNGTNYLSKQCEYTYEGSNLITIMLYSGSYYGATLENSTKIEYSYDTNGNRTQEIDYRWSFNNQIWTNSYKCVYSYDSSVNVANVVWPLPGNSWIKNKITSFQAILWMIKQAGEQPQWYPQPVRQYYYSDYSGILPLSIEQTSTNTINLCLSPNPFTTTTSIKYKVTKPGFVSLKVFDAMGTEVATLVNKQQTVGEFTVVLNAAGLSDGIYFCRLQEGLFSETKKLVLQK